MAQPITINDCMHKNPLTIHVDAPLVQAVESLLEYKLTGLTVTDDEGLAVGSLSELDCLKCILNAIYNAGDPQHSRVKDAMRANPDVCRPGDSIVEVAQSMLQSGQRRQSVIEDGRLVGQVSSSNILWALMEHSRSKSFESKK